jgi:hypothetical protein
MMGKESMGKYRGYVLLEQNIRLSVSAVLVHILLLMHHIDRTIMWLFDMGLA